MAHFLKKRKKRNWAIDKTMERFELFDSKKTVPLTSPKAKQERS